MDKRFVAILGGLIIIFGGIFFFSQKSSDKNSTNGQPTNHVEGKGTTGVRFVEYGDYECPVCQAYESTVSKVVGYYGNKIAFQFRNLPLDAIHNNARAGARAAEAAGLQGKYWEMHTLLYDKQNWQEWSPNTVKNPRPFLEKYAQQLGLDITKFNSDFNSGQVNDLINADLAEFKKTGQQMATPAFFLNGAFLDLKNLTDPATGVPQFEKFKAVIDAAIAKQNK